MSKHHAICMLSRRLRRIGLSFGNLFGMILGILATVFTLLYTTDWLAPTDSQGRVKSIHPAQYDPYYHRELVDHPSVTLKVSPGEDPATWYDYYNYIQMKPATDPKALEEKFFTSEKKFPCVRDSLSISFSQQPAGTTRNDVAPV